MVKVAKRESSDRFVPHPGPKADIVFGAVLYLIHELIRHVDQLHQRRPDGGE